MNIGQDDCDDTTQGTIGWVARKLGVGHTLDFLFPYGNLAKGRHDASTYYQVSGNVYQ